MRQDRAARRAVSMSRAHTCHAALCPRPGVLYESVSLGKKETITSLSSSSHIWPTSRHNGIHGILTQPFQHTIPSLVSINRLVSTFTSQNHLEKAVDDFR